MGKTAFVFSMSLSVVFAVPALGQEEAGAGDLEEEVMEEVVVTGSRIKRSNLDSPAPVMVFDSQQLLNNGITTMDEFARYLPQNADNFSDSFTTGSSFRGSAAFNLRGVGADATLTLVNGRRVAPFGSSGDEVPFVDINAIPVAAIERIEILKDGASAVYGSEAVAGVVNIITRKSIEGVVVEGGYMSTTEGDGEEWDISIAAGWEGAATRLAGTLSHFDRDPIYKRDRDWSDDIDLREQGGQNSRSFLSSPPSAFLIETGGIGADPECPEQTDRNSKEVVVPGIVEFCRFNWAYFMTLQQPSERTGLTASLEHDFGNDLTLFAELLLNRNQTQSIMAPTPYINFFVPAFHPDNPFGQDVFLAGRTLDTGDRGFDTQVTTWRAVSGLRGNLSEWEWEAALMASESESENKRFNAVLRNEFQKGMFGLAGPNGDRFYNPFGLNPQNDPEVIDSMTISGTRVISTSSELTLDLLLTGDFGNLPGGAIGAAFGMQGRAQELDQVADEAELSGNFLGGGGILPLNEDREIYSVFTEFALPLHETLEAQLALRYDHYSDFGSTTNPKIGLGWRPVDEFLLRATWGTSFRPPTFRELYSPRETYLALVEEDPHRCPATGDVFDCFGNVVEAEFQGNADLQPDEGETLLLGFAWEPQFAPGLELAVDLWQIEHKDRILDSGSFILQELLLEELDPFTNPFTIRAPQTPEDAALGIPGVIVGLSDTYVNGDTLDTNGVDFALMYDWSTSRSGDFNASVNYTYLNEYFVGTDFRELKLREDWAGQYGFIGGLPKHRANFRFNWMREAHGVSALIAYAGDYESWLNLHVDGIETDQPFVIDDYAQLDLQYSYVFERLRGGMIRVGCRNCTDEDPPVYNQTVDSEAFHEGRGAMVYIRWSQPF